MLITISTTINPITKGIQKKNTKLINIGTPSTLKNIMEMIPLTNIKTAEAVPADSVVGVLICVPANPNADTIIEVSIK